VEKSVEKSVEVATVLDAHGQVQRVVYVNYRMFREGLLPVLAAKKGLAMDRVMFLLSRCEASTRMISGACVHVCVCARVCVRACDCTVLCSVLYCTVVYCTVLYCSVV
jgi:hypothetical protein